MGGAAKAVKNAVGSVLNNPVTQLVSDVAATATGNPELIPIINAGESTAGNLASGQSLGKSLGQGAISGGESLAGQELAGAVGIGSGNDILNNALGVTTSPSSTGLPDIGSLLTNAGNSLSDTLSSTFGLTPNTNTADLNVNSNYSPGAVVGSDLAAPTVAPVAGTTGQAASVSGLTDADQNFINQAINSANTTNATGSIVPTAGSTSGGGVLSWLKNNLGVSPLQALAGGGLAASALKGTPSTGANTNLISSTGVEQQAGQNLVNNASQGNLLPGQTSVFTQQLNDAISGIRSKFASLGLSGSSMEQEAIENAQNQYASAVANQLTTNINTGLSALGQQTAADQNIANEALQSDQSLYNAIAAMAGLVTPNQKLNVNVG